MSLGKKKKEPERASDDMGYKFPKDARVCPNCAATFSTRAALIKHYHHYHRGFTDPNLMLVSYI